MTDFSADVLRQGKAVADDCRPLREAVKRGEVKMRAKVRGQYPGVPIPDERLPGLRTIGYWDAVGTQSWGLPMHFNEGLEICYMVHGETVFGTADEQVLLRPGDLTITRPWQRHYLGDPFIGPCRLFWLILDVASSPSDGEWTFPDWVGPDADTRRSLLRIFRSNQRCYLSEGGRSLAPQIDNACRALADDSELALGCLALAVNEVVLQVARILTTGNLRPASDTEGVTQTVKQFFQSLEANEESVAEPWTVEEMARVCRVGPTYFNRACKLIFNTTPASQLRRIRLAHGARLLVERRDLSVTEVAFEVGFSTGQYFATCFRKSFGKTPKEYARDFREG